MKKYIALLLAFSLAACGNDTPPPQAQQPVVIQQAPAQAPVVVQQDNSGANMLAGAALGAAAAMALSDRDRHYNSRPQNVEYEHKTTIVNNYHTPAPEVKAPVAAAAATAAAPVAAAAAVNLAKTAPPVTTKPNFAAPGTSSPVPVASQSFLTGNKTLTVSNTPATKSYAPAATPAVSLTKAPAALPAPTKVNLTKPAPLALPAPTPKPTYKAASIPSNYNYKPSKPVQASYSPPKATKTTYSAKPSYKPTSSYSARK